MAKIAIVDDDSDFVDLIAAALHEFGYETGSCTTAGDAYSFICREMPDVAMVDMKMGTGYDGVQIITALKLNGETAAIPVILCTGRADAEVFNLSQSSDTPAVRILHKPFDLSELRQAVAEEIANAEAATTN